MRLLVAALLLTGCTPKPESVCKKLDGLSSVEHKEDAKAVARRHDDCVGSLAAVKEANPAGYKHLTECANKPSWNAARDCMGSVIDKDKLQGAFDAWHRQKLVDRVNSWPDAKTKTVQGKIKSYQGERATSFTIELAETFAPEADIKRDTMVLYRMEGGDEQLIGPIITVQNGIGAPDLEGAIKNSETTGHTIVDKKKTDAGYILAEESDAGVTVRSVVGNGDSSIECEARLMEEEERSVKDKLIPWLEKMCGSLSVKP